MDDKIYIKKIVRNDGKVLEFDAKNILLAQENTLLARADPDTTSMGYTEADGGEMISQRSEIYEQEIQGLIVPRDATYWDLSLKLSQFFKLNYTYKIIYIRRDGAMFSVSNAWISTGLQIVPRPREDYSPWSITLSIGDMDWREYAEDESGDEVYSNKVLLPLVNSKIGGEEWDAVGEVWDGVGGVWSSGAGGVQAVEIDSTKLVYPVWTVEGPCTNPKLQNNTTDTQASFDGTVAEGQTLTVDFAAGVAHINGALVTRLVSGLVSFIPGENLVGFNSDGGSTAFSTISWNNVIN